MSVIPWIPFVKRLFILTLVYVLGTWGFLLSLMVPWLPLGQIQKISLAEALMVTGGLFSIGIIFSLSNALMAMYLVIHHWTHPGPGLHPSQHPQQKRCRILGVLALTVANLPVIGLLFYTIAQIKKNLPADEHTTMVWFGFFATAWMAYGYLCITWINKQVIPIWQLLVGGIYFTCSIFLKLANGVKVDDPSWKDLLVPMHIGIYLFFPAFTLVPHLIRYHWLHAKHMKNRGILPARLTA